jgi:hypothetical protein
MVLLGPTTIAFGPMLVSLAVLVLLALSAASAPYRFGNRLVGAPASAPAAARAADVDGADR